MISRMIACNQLQISNINFLYVMHVAIEKTDAIVHIMVYGKK
jgi:hypothetical protein